MMTMWAYEAEASLAISPGFRKMRPAAGAKRN
jgi:hypothetical protein